MGKLILILVANIYIVKPYIGQAVNIRLELYTNKSVTNTFSTTLYLSDKCIITRSYYQVYTGVTQ